MGRAGEYAWRCNRNNTTVSCGARPSVAEVIALNEVPDSRAALYDVAVLGGGNAALCAAMSAAELGARVVMLESAPRHFRGGNSRHTRNLRYAHDEATAYLTGPYTEDEFWDDLLRVTDGDTDERLARLTIRASKDVGRWMEAHGARFQPALAGSLQLSRTNAFFRGGGKALLNAYYRTAERAGVEVVYDAEATDVVFDQEPTVAVRARESGLRGYP